MSFKDIRIIYRRFGEGSGEDAEGGAGFEAAIGVIFGTENRR